MSIISAICAPGVARSRRANGSTDSPVARGRNQVLRMCVLGKTDSGGRLDFTVSPNPADARVGDFYRVEDCNLAENWIFIDTRGANGPSRPGSEVNVDGLAGVHIHPRVDPVCG
ncbi:hypothetical protein [Paenarthrobacter sp. AMU7]|uniref:Uncharacterized protein n=1 Tax=Paenarthrobacter sp. AMU7 TaxID=3162492 RepID=A0AB39YQP9_9MICC